MTSNASSGIPEQEESSPRPDEMSSAGEPVIKPMTAGQLGRWFALPFLIIVAIVGGAVTVVFLFGAPASQASHSVEELLAALEAASGQKNMGMLLPRDKEHWQTGLELTLRLRKKDEGEGMTEAELTSVAERIGAMIREEVSHPDFARSSAAAGVSQASRRSTRLEFLIRSLGLTGRSEAVEPLIGVLRSGHDLYAALAMQQLANLGALEETRAAIDPMLDVLKASKTPEVMLTACTALSVLASSEDAGIIEAIGDVASAGEGEVAWSAALALARLGNADGKLTLMDLLDRSYWEKGDRYRVTDASGTIIRRPMPPGRIEELLISAINAASNLNDSDLWNEIHRLKSDSSPRVRAVAAKASAARSG